MDVQIIDGGLSTELIRNGFPVASENDPLWTSRYLFEDQNALKKAHLSFLEHGADIILTATYQASIDLFQKKGPVTEEDFKKLICCACSIAQEARQDFLRKSNINGRKTPVIAGSVGPYGACQCDFSEYHGKYVDNMTIEELVSWHRPRIQALVEGEVDLLALETIPSVKEAEALLQLLGDFPQMKAWMTFSCKDKSHIGHGELFSEAVRLVASSSQIIAVGVNCCPAENVLDLLQSASSARHGKPIVVYPNSPAEQWTNNSVCGKTTAYEMDAFIPAWIEAGARYVGGCCGTGALEIKHIASIVHNLNR